MSAYCPEHQPRPDAAAYGPNRKGYQLALALWARETGRAPEPCTR